MANEQVAYHSYLLRLWREEANHKSVWRASLESAQTGERLYFASIHDLTAYLLTQSPSTGVTHNDLPNQG